MITKLWERMAGWLGLLGGLVLAGVVLLQVGRRRAGGRQRKNNMRRICPPWRYREM